MKRVAFAVVLFAVFAPACEDETIVLATIPEADAGGSRPLTRCSSPADCAPGLFCDKHHCEDAVGTCDVLPAFCDDAAKPVCGCDGITYMNDCLRHAAGVTRASDGECPGGVAAPCGGPLGPCPPGAVCVQLLPPSFDPRMCPPEIRGTCWVAPATCPPSATSDRWNGCGPGGDRCVDTCAAIKSGVPHVRAISCP